MKKSNNLLFLMVLFFFISANCHAQDDDTNYSKFYVRIGGGYSFQTGKTEFNNADPNGITGIQQSTDISFNGTGLVVKSLNGTLGGGTKINFTAGYMFNQYMGAEIGINYFHGDKVKIGKLNVPQIQSDEKAYLRGFDLAPAFYLTPALTKLNPYSRIGLLMTLGGKLNIENTAYIVDGLADGTDLDVTANAEVKGKFSVGYIAAAGVEYPIGDNLKLFVEVEYKNFSIKSKSAEITEYTAYAVTGGQSQQVQSVDDLPVSEKKFIFSDEYTSSTGSNTEPTKIPTQYINASGTGFNIGVKYSF